MIDRIVSTMLRLPALALILVVVILVMGWQAFDHNPKDAIPDIAENQAIVFAEWSGRSPRDVDEQVTYPLTVALQGVPGVREVRATSGFGWAIVFTIFNDDVDFYWARSRVLERLAGIGEELPDGVSPRLGPDATPLGQVLWYTVENGWYCPDHPGLRFDEDGNPLRSEAAGDPRPPDSGAGAGAGAGAGEASLPRCPHDGQPLVHSGLSLEALRSIQDYEVRLALQSVEGVSEVAGIGGFKRQYHVDVDPEAMVAYRVDLDTVVAAIKGSNLDVGAEVVEVNGMELAVRGVGFIGGAERSRGSRLEREQAVIRDLESTVVSAAGGTPVYLRQLATISTGPDFRRGALDKMGAEAVGGCVVMRFGENPLEVIDRVKAQIAEIEAGLPPGVRIVAFYDRSELIGETMSTLGGTLLQAVLLTALAVLLFLLRPRAALAVAATFPLAVLLAFIGMEILGIGSNIMSLAGIAIAIGTLDDLAIIMIESIDQHLGRRRNEYLSEDPVSGRQLVDRERRRDVVRQGAVEVGGAIVTAATTTVISFLPVLLLDGEAGRLFGPLAWTKTLCMVGAVVLTLLVLPVLASLLLSTRAVRGRKRLLISLVAGTAAGLAWLLGPLLSDGWRQLAVAARDHLHLAAPLDTLVLTLAVGLWLWASLGERARDADENPLSRAISRVYEPTLRWLMAHRLLFLGAVSAVVLAGLSVWLGAGRLAGPLLDGLAWLGLDLGSWSLAWWVHLVAGLLCGLVLLPLLVDTGRWALGREPLRRKAGHWLIGAGVALAVALGLQGTSMADRFGTQLATVLGIGNGQAVQPSAYAPVAAWRQASTGIGQEFMPPLDEGDFLYMPSLLPAASISSVMDVMEKQDVQFTRLPEVETVVGKLGRIDSALDPAPLGMLETLVKLKPWSEWPLVEDPQRPGHLRRRTSSEVWAAIREAGEFPGVLPSVRLQPIRTRVEMLSTGLNARIGIKVYADSLEAAEEAAVAVEQVLRQDLEGAETVNAIRANRKPYLEIAVDRQAAARYGLRLADVQRAIQYAIGGIGIASTYEGLDRYPIRVRYARELRDDLPDLERVLVPAPGGRQIPLGLLATLETVPGPMSIRREGARYLSYVTMSAVDGVDEATLVRRGQEALDRAVVDGRLELPPGSQLSWSGTWQRHARTQRRLALIIPAVLLINLLLISLHFKRLSLSLLVFSAIPVSLAGGFLMLDWWPGIHNAFYQLGLLERGFEGQAMFLTTAVWVGFIALFGIAVDDGVVMGTYLSQTFTPGSVSSFAEIRERVVEAGLRRIRPCLMTSLTTVAGLMPVLLATGRGSDAMAPMAVPVLGGVIAALISLWVVPVGFAALLELKWRLGLSDPAFAADRAPGVPQLLDEQQQVRS